MKANEFVKKFGWFATTRLVNGIDTTNDPHFSILLNDLKRLVESHELVERLGGLKKAKEYVPDNYKSEQLKQAIADVESCMEVKSEN
ncbi:hypothetical protein [Acinetobacter sp. RF14B]|uniref:hypothetical protein n=1 Tax=Acinetobacter sp. RF14B TaxID=2650965 RepID=UPI0011732319|nr:hypothetical protein [Acinetobacter sp. RF14B]TQR66828.1 hypothetical protein E2K52_05420 [Acinetobacter sp. RF14B]